MKKLAVLVVVMCACGPDASTPHDAGTDGHPDGMADAMVDAPIDAPQCVGVDDGIACTVDTCDMATGQVTHTPTNTLCNDDVACTTDTCDATSGCVYTPEDTACDDGVDCTVDASDATNGCSHTTMDSLCEADGASCTVAHCDAAAGCSEVPTNAMCDDGATCSTDTCDPMATGADAATGCVYDLDNNACADTAECSTDACSPGTAGADATSGCLYTADPTACDANATCASGFDCTCNTGYMGDGLTCSAVTVTCDTLTDPAHGSVSVDNGGIFPSTATYTCDRGYALTATATRSCGNDGHWSGAAPTCEATIFVVRAGDGAAALRSAAAAVYVEERSTVDGSVIRTITLPATGGAQNALTQSGSATTEGHINRSTDGRYVVVAGYAADAGTAGIANTANLSSGPATNRVVGRIDSNGVVDTSTLLVDAFSGGSSAGNPRGVASVEGTAFWVTGTGQSSTGGVYYVALGSTGTAVHLSGTNLTQAAIADGQLYDTSTSQVEAVGTGLPTTTGQTTTGIAPGLSSARGFALVDTDATAGADTLFIAIDSSSGTTDVINVQKWTFDGTAWTKDAAFQPQLTGVSGGSSGVRGLTAWVDGGQVHVVATLSGGAGNRLVGFIVDSETPTVNVLATADANTQFRGVAPSPNVAP
jgi:hypothetical protein